MLARHDIDRVVSTIRTACPLTEGQFVDLGARLESSIEILGKLTDTFGRPWRVFGVECGLGLVVSSLLFGAIHVLNTVDYFTGQFEFAWWLGVTNVFAGFSLGLLREKTGNVVAGGVAHGLMDVLVQIPRILASKR